jgi:dUTP pyrophosphatase
MNPITIREKLFSTFDPNSGYTMADFEREMNSTKVESNVGYLEFELVNNSHNPDPEYATEESAGFDLRANFKDSTNGLIIPSGKFGVVQTGLFFGIPKGFEIQIRPRSGLAAKFGVTVLNSPGTIDSDYVGEIGVILINHGSEPFIVNQGDRIAQAVIATTTAKPVVKFKKVTEIKKDTERGSGGFGSTGYQ